MLFSSNVFLFAFLPAVLLVHLLLPHRARNPFLSLCTVFFWWWSGGPVALVFVACLVVCYFSGRYIGSAGVFGARVCLTLVIAFDLSLLIYFKYFNFIFNQMALFLGLFHVSLRQPPAVALPVGISFFIFEAISYPVEIFRKSETPAKRLRDFGAYLGLFPHFVAGPIVRYSDVSEKLPRREVTVEAYFSGVLRFAQGLGKKVLIADNLAIVADKVFRLGPATLTTPLAWLGIACYTFQIYYDFSGYSDMAIGIGKFLGFDFPENFDQPYRSKNITEFWQRWHITLSSWFRDYLFIPLGANRKGEFRTYLNLLVVFFLCGLWHGAAWTFVFWGVYHGVLLSLERGLRTRFGFQMSGKGGSLATLMLVGVGWVFFRSGSMATALGFLKVLFHPTAASGFQFFPFRFYLTNDALFYLLCAALFAWFPVERLEASAALKKPFWVAAQGLAALLLIVYSASVLSTAAFNPFIYFRF